MKNYILVILWLCTLLLPQMSLLGRRTLNVVRDYGADNMGKTYATVHIQDAIDAFHPGDTLLIPPGTYLMNSGLNLKSDMTVVLSGLRGIN